MRFGQTPRAMRRQSDNLEGAVQECPLIAHSRRPQSTDSVEVPGALKMAMRARGSCRRGEAKSSPSASCGEYGRRERDELRQVPQILGGGGQKEFVFCSVWAALAQSIEPEDAFQMSEEHPDLLSLRHETT